MAQAVTPLTRDPQIEALKLPPYSIEAEQSVLGGLLLDNNAFDRISDFLVEGDFYRADHRQIFHHIALLIADSKPADALTVAESLQRSAKLDDIEDSGQHELLNWFCLAGAMSELGHGAADHAVFLESWVTNSDKVFAVFTDIEHGAEHVSGIKGIELLTPGKFGLGTRWTEAREVLGVEGAYEVDSARESAIFREEPWPHGDEKAA